MAEEHDRERLSDEERGQLAHLLHRYCEAELDQFDHWVIGSSWGDVYIDIARKLSPGASPDHYTRVPRPVELAQHDE
jgi:hypothetical protein